MQDVHAQEGNHMNIRDKRVSRGELLAALGAAGVGIASASALGGSSAAYATAPDDWHNVKGDYGAVGDGTTDDTTAINNAITGAAAAGGTVYFPPGTYRVNGTIEVGALAVQAAFGAVIEHYPANDTTDCMVITASMPDGRRYPAFKSREGRTGTRLAGI
jgi:hypothetical protein